MSADTETSADELDYEDVLAEKPMTWKERRVERKMFREIKEVISGPSMGPKHYLFLFLVTGAYLLFELAFNARLLDVVGTTLDHDAVEQIEWFGRLISGLALTLVFWPKILKKSVKKYRGQFSTGFRLSVTLIICCAASYWIQEGILQGITATSNPAQRRAAATLVTLTDAVHSEEVALDGLSMEEVDLSSPEGKTFLAILPALALSTDNLEDKTENELAEVIRRLADSKIGGPEGLFNDAYLVSEARIKEAFNGYLKLAEPFDKLVQAVPGEQAKAYREYRNSLGRYTPYTLPKVYYKRVRRKLSQKGLSLPYDWDPRDKAGFYKAVENKVLSYHDDLYENKMYTEFGYHLPSDLTFEEFTQHPRVQADWRKSMEIIGEYPLRANWSFEQFRDQMYAPWMRDLVATEVSKLLAPVETFAAGGENEVLGLDAIRAAYVPLIAFIFSTIGALVHTFKTVWFGSLAAVRQKILATPILAGFATAVIGLWVVPAATTTNGVSQSLLFTKLEQDTAEKAGIGLAFAIRSLVQAQTEFYPISEGIRRTALLGYEFEY